MHGLAFILSELGLHDEVEALIMDTVEHPDPTRDVPHKALADLLLVLVHSYIHRSRFAEAIPLLERAIPMREKLRQPYDNGILGPVTNMGYCKMILKSFTGAEIYLKRAVEGYGS